ncbi:MAG: deoxyribose-phosphate aldolase [Candidatus Kentron sp. G]|nr:MAG: deoxyribose-phosphate aldolase [Candidatus Kentron sp. G]VFN06908.1 MAG: deoxyribose-phosphate aldolase [Candidatus Kentron sp. G]
MWDATPEITRAVTLCKEAIEYRFASVCVNPCNVAYVVELLDGHGIRVCSVAGFPLGANKTGVKVYEARSLVDDGAKEIDMVMNIGALKNKDYALAEQDIRAVRESIGKDIVLKVIIESPLLTEEEKIEATQMVVSANADYVKTTTGMNSVGGATVQDVALMKKTAKGKVKVKAAGGIRDYEKAMAMVEAGADRIGTSSAAAILLNSRLR